MYSPWGTFRYHSFAECAYCERQRGATWANKRCPSVCILWVFWMVSFLAGFTIKKLYTFLSFPMHATCFTQFVILDFIVLIIFVEEYKSWSMLLPRFLQLPITSCLVCPYIFRSILFLNTFSLRTALFWAIMRQVAVISYRCSWPLKMGLIGCPETSVRNCC